MEVTLHPNLSEKPPVYRQIQWIKIFVGTLVYLAILTWLNFSTAFNHVSLAYLTVGYFGGSGAPAPTASALFLSAFPFIGIIGVSVLARIKSKVPLFDVIAALCVAISLSLVYGQTIALVRSNVLNQYQDLVASFDKSKLILDTASSSYSFVASTQNSTSSGILIINDVADTSNLPDGTYEIGMFMLIPGEARMGLSNTDFSIDSYLIPPVNSYPMVN